MDVLNGNPVVVLEYLLTNKLIINKKESSLKNKEDSFFYKSNILFENFNI